MPIWKQHKASRLQKLLGYTQKEGLRHEIYTKRDVYIGYWHKSERHGNGLSKSFKSKSLYEGQWKNNERNGYGSFSKAVTHPNYFSDQYRLIYEGSWERGKPHGVGCRHYQDGTYYEGTWENGKRSGWGRIWYPDGGFYDGYWENNKEHGPGIYVFPNGNRYEGDWSEGLKHGAGVFLHFQTGQEQRGIWDKGMCVASLITDVRSRQSAEKPTVYPIKEVMILAAFIKTKIPSFVPSKPPSEDDYDDEEEEEDED